MASSLTRAFICSGTLQSEVVYLDAQKIKSELCTSFGSLPVVGIANDTRIAFMDQLAFKAVY